MSPTDSEITDRAFQALWKADSYTLRDICMGALRLHGVATTHRLVLALLTDLAVQRFPMASSMPAPTFTEDESQPVAHRRKRLADRVFSEIVTRQSGAAESTMESPLLSTPEGTGALLDHLLPMMIDSALFAPTPQNVSIKPYTLAASLGLVRRRDTQGVGDLVRTSMKHYGVNALIEYMIYWGEYIVRAAKLPTGQLVFAYTGAQVAVGDDNGEKFDNPDAVDMPFERRCALWAVRFLIYVRDHDLEAATDLLLGIARQSPILGTGMTEALLHELETVSSGYPTTLVEAVTPVDGE